MLTILRDAGQIDCLRGMGQVDYLLLPKDK